MQVSAPDSIKAGAVYSKYKEPLLTTMPSAKSKELLAREEDVQVLHGFDTQASAKSYLKSAPLFNNDVVGALKPLIMTEPEIRNLRRTIE